MNIPSGAKAFAAPKTTQTQLPKKSNEVAYTPTESDSSLFEDGWVGTSLSLAGGAAALFGAVTDNPAVAIGGMVASSAGMAVTAYRTQMNGAVDQAAKLSFVGGLGATAASALLLSLPAATPKPTGMVPQLIERLGLHGL